MGHIILLLVSLTFIGCQSKPLNVYDETNYTLIQTDTFQGILDRRIFVYKYDTSRKMQINYWDNGNILAKGFSHKQKLDGRFEMYYITGKLMQVDSFFDGNKISSIKNHNTDTSIKIFRNGKLEPFTSIDSVQ